MAERTVAGYTLTAKLGEGPHGVVYKAVKTDTSEPFAMKIVKPALAPKSEEQTRWVSRVFNMLSKIQHNSIVRVFEGGQAGNLFYIVMELVEGRSLARTLAEIGPLSEADASKMLNQLAQALVTTHKRGIIHGDIKPENVFLVNGTYKLSDFYIKQALTGEVPVEGSIEDITAETEKRDQTTRGSSRSTMTAEDLLRQRQRKKGLGLNAGVDLLALGSTFLQAVGCKLPPEPPLLSDYRRLLYDIVADLIYNKGFDQRVATVVKGLIVEDGIKSVDALVVDLVSARVLARQSTVDAVPSNSKNSSAPPPDAKAKPQATRQTEPEPANEEKPPSPMELEPDSTAETINLERTDFKDADETPTSLGFQPSMLTGSFLFIWQDSQDGMFRCIKDKDELTIGRDSSRSELVVLDRSVSRLHCIVRNEGGEMSVTDAGSSNGTFVNGKKITRAILNSDDEVRIGSTRIYLSLNPAQGMNVQK